MRNPFKKKDTDLCFIIFCIGVFLLPSAFFISSILFLISIVGNFFKEKNNFFDDKWNLSFLIGSLLMILSASIQSLNYENIYNYDFDINLTWIGLANWIPFFWCFWSFKSFLNSPEKRKLISLIFISGSITVLATGLGQVFFSWHGPLKTFYDLIIWYQRPSEQVTGLTGLFNNANYAGSWLNIIWPFTLACLIEKKEKPLEKISIYLFIFGISLSTILTNSRAAWLGILIGSGIMYGDKSLKIIRNLLILITIIISCTIYPVLGNFIQNFLREIIPKSIWLEFSDFQYTRIEIWQSGILHVLHHPLFGTGASSFPEIFRSQTGLWKGHAHNLPLELIISYGIPAGLCILLPICLILYRSTKNIFFANLQFANSIYDRAWISSLIVLLISQMVDVQYFDGRISIILWILLSGARNMINEQKYKIKREAT